MRRGGLCPTVSGEGRRTAGTVGCAKCGECSWPWRYSESRLGVREGDEAQGEVWGGFGYGRRTGWFSRGAAEVPHTFLKAIRTWNHQVVAERNGRMEHLTAFVGVQIMLDQKASQFRERVDMVLAVFNLDGYGEAGAIPLLGILKGAAQFGDGREFAQVDALTTIVLHAQRQIKTPLKVVLSFFERIVFEGDSTQEREVYAFAATVPYLMADGKALLEIRARDVILLCFQRDERQLGQVYALAGAVMHFSVYGEALLEEAFRRREIAAIQREPTEL